MKKNIKIRKMEEKDLDAFYYWNNPSREFHKYNGPYFKKDNLEALSAKVNQWRLEFTDGVEDIRPDAMMIVDAETDELIGQVGCYWKSIETNWLEVGLVIFNEGYWGQGIGYDALKIWINYQFKIKTEIIRIGLSTWSGNIGMIKLAEKLNLKKEAVYRKARIVNGEYYDSISYGILREEWFVDAN